jgi:hypothetical protein
MNINDINNIVIIRFSIRSKFLHIFSNEEDRTAYLLFRVKIFKSYLYNCLQYQTKSPNKVYVLVDKGDIDIVKKYLNIDNITIIYCNNDLQYFKQQIAVDLYKSKLTKNLVISRIDSDDLINKDFFYNMNQQLLLHPTKRLVACKGYLTDLIDIQSLFYKHSPFISECINFENNLTEHELIKNLCSFSVYDIDHTIYVHSVEHTQNHNAEWIQLVHGTNLSNKLLDQNTDSINSTKFVSPLIPINPTWFSNWAGFQLTQMPKSDFV